LQYKYLNLLCLFVYFNYRFQHPLLEHFLGYGTTILTHRAYHPILAPVLQNDFQHTCNKRLLWDCEADKYKHKFQILRLTIDYVNVT